MAEIQILVVVEPRKFITDVDSLEWAAMSEDERLEYVHDCAQECDAFTVRYEHPLPHREIPHHE